MSGQPVLAFIFNWLHKNDDGQEAKAAAAFKAQIEKLQQERDEFQRMVIGNQVRFFVLIWLSVGSCYITCTTPNTFSMLQKQVRTQQIHEMKKKEKEYIKLQVEFLSLVLVASWRIFNLLKMGKYTYYKLLIR